MKAHSYNPFQAIESLFTQRRKDHSDGPEDFEAKVAASILKLSQAYSTSRHPDFEDSFDRLAYVIQYAPIGMVAIRKLCGRLRTKRLPAQWSVLNSEPLHIVSVGAGPGTDLFGMLMEFAVPPAGLRFCRIDGHTKWKTYYESFRNDFGEQISELKPILDTMDEQFVQSDFRSDSLSSGSSQKHLAVADIVILNRVLSTFKDDEGFVLDLLHDIAKVCTDGTLIFVLDVRSPSESFNRILALTEGICRLEKRSSRCLAKFTELTETHFGWHIPESLTALEKHGRRITRSGSFFGGVVLLASQPEPC